MSKAQESIREVLQLARLIDDSIRAYPDSEHPNLVRLHEVLLVTAETVAGECLRALEEAGK